VSLGKSKALMRKRPFRASSPLFEIASLLGLLNHVARFIVNANHGIM
jgi:hypothetical protein